MKKERRPRPRGKELKTGGRPWLEIDAASASRKFDVDRKVTCVANKQN